MPIIKIRDVVKRYGDIVAVAGVSLDVEEGECFGLLGPNGAGKTTLVRMITATSPLAEGAIWVDGKDIARQPREVKARIGIVPQEQNLDPDLTVLQNLVTFARYFDIPRGEAQSRALANLRLFELSERQKSKIDELSGGMKRRLLIARGLINQPKLLILDEPTVGLDPQTRHLVWQKLRSLKEQGVTLLLTTQNMDEAQRLCDRVAIMNEGKIIALGTPQELVARCGGGKVLEARLKAGYRDMVLAGLRRKRVQWQEIEDTLYIFLADEQLPEEELRQGLIIIDQHVPNLEDVFLRLTGRSLTE